MPTDLFGDEIARMIDSAEQELNSYDTESFHERAKRLRLINQSFPYGDRLFGSYESSKIFDEAIHCYVFGQFIATIILAQAFIERRFQEYFNLSGDNGRAKYTLDQFIKEFKGTEFLPDFVLEKIDKIRLKRNPFLHHRKPLQENTLMARALMTKTDPEYLLETDAKDAIHVMFEMSQRRLL
jgi:hypothetical protein